MSNKTSTAAAAIASGGEPVAQKQIATVTVDDAGEGEDEEEYYEDEENEEEGEGEEEEEYEPRAKKGRANTVKKSAPSPVKSTGGSGGGSGADTKGRHPGRKPKAEKVWETATEEAHEAYKQYSLKCIPRTPQPFHLWIVQWRKEGDKLMVGKDLVRRWTERVKAIQDAATKLAEEMAAKHEEMED